MNGMFVSRFFTVYPARFILREWPRLALPEPALRDAVPEDKINPRLEHRPSTPRHRWTPPRAEFSFALGLYYKSMTKLGFVRQLASIPVPKTRQNETPQTPKP